MTNMNSRLSPDINVTDIQVSVIGEVRLGKRTLVEAHTTPEGGSVTFQSTDTSMAAIVPNLCACHENYGSCFIVPIKLGNFCLVVQSDEVKKYINLAVLPSEDIPIDPDPSKSLKLSVDSLVMKLGDSFTIKAITKPEYSPVMWTSSNPAIASVINGIVTANNKGNVTITAMMDDLRAYCNVSVSELGIKDQVYKIVVGQHLTIPIDVYPNNLPIYWQSDDTSIVEVTTRGVLVGVSLGKTIVTATVVTATGPITNTIYVEVVNSFEPINDFCEVDLDNIEMYCTEEDLRLANTGVTIKTLPETLLVPKLYYVRVDENPYIFNYKLCAVREDIDKYLLRHIHHGCNK